MRKTVLLFLIVSVAVAFAFTFAACVSPPPPPPPPPAEENPNAGPEITLKIPELFSPDPDIVDDKMTIGITVNHPVPIKDWTITITPIRRQASQRTEGDAAGAAQQQQRQRPEGQAAGEEQGQRRRSGPFFEQSGTGTPAHDWQWNGRSASGEMVQSATNYRFVLSVNDVYENNSVAEGEISVDIIVRREGEQLRMVVPSIVFPPDSSDFRLLGQDDARANARVLMMIARALNRFADYRITVEGHANPTTPPNTAQRTTEEAGARGIIGLRPLSESRAGAVVDYLVTTNGIARARLSAVGMGGSRTVADYADDEENWKNRRVEFILHK